MLSSEGSCAMLEQKCAVEAIVRTTEGEHVLFIKQVLIKMHWILFLNCGNM